jgi:hypothetical protein
MALTALQRRLCHLIAENRIAAGDSYVAGAAALNEILSGARLSHDIDLFHDAAEAVATSWAADRHLFESHGFSVQVLRELPSFVEAVVSTPLESTRIQWTHDSAYRFFPLVRHPDFGLALHPFDLATNKILALIGRVEVRDWVDAIQCAERLQPLGYLAWAASGKDPGFSPAGILDHAARTSRYSTEEVAELMFDGPPPDAADLSRRWRALLDAGREIVPILPGDAMGTCVLDRHGSLYGGDANHLRHALADGAIVFHAGRLRGALPQIQP